MHCPYYAAALASLAISKSRVFQQRERTERWSYLHIWKSQRSARKKKGRQDGRGLNTEEGVDGSASIFVMAVCAASFQDNRNLSSWPTTSGEESKFYRRARSRCERTSGTVGGSSALSMGQLYNPLYLCLQRLSVARQRPRRIQVSHVTVALPADLPTYRPFRDIIK